MWIKSGGSSAGEAAPNIRNLHRDGPTCRMLKSGEHKTPRQKRAIQAGVEQEKESGKKAGSIHGKQSGVGNYAVLFDE